MMGYKWFLQSRMVWGLIGYVLSKYGIELDDDLKQQLQDGLLKWIDITVQVVSLITAIYGARKAEKNLTVLPWRKGL